MTPPHFKRLFRNLPPHIDPHDPRIIAWQIEHMQDIAEDHNHRLSQIEGRPSNTEAIVQSIPWARLLPILLLLALFLTGVLSRQETKDIGMKLFGVFSWH